jgi:hypothetical protein
VQLVVQRRSRVSCDSIGIAVFVAGRSSTAEIVGVTASVGWKERRDDEEIT